MRIHKEVEVDAAHRHLHHEGKCGGLHGHRWTFEFTLEGPTDEETGMVADFGDIEDLAEDFDHVTLLNEDDELVAVLERHGQPVKSLSFDPTAENLARQLHDEVVEEFGDGVRASILVRETPTNWAQWPI